MKELDALLLSIMKSQDAESIKWVFECPNADLTHLFQTAFLNLELIEPNTRAFTALISKYNQLAPDDPPGFADQKTKKQPPECFKSIFTPEVIESFKKYITNLMNVKFGYNNINSIFSLKYIPAFPLIKEMFIKDADKAVGFSYIFRDAFNTLPTTQQPEILMFDRQPKLSERTDWSTLYASYCANVIRTLSDADLRKELQRKLIYLSTALSCNSVILESLYLGITRERDVLWILQRSEGLLVADILEKLGHKNRLQLIERKPHFFLKILNTIQNPEYLLQDVYEDQDWEPLSGKLSMLDMAFLMHGECELVWKMKEMGYHFSEYDYLENLELFIHTMANDYYYQQEYNKEVLAFIEHYNLRLPILYRNAPHTRGIDEHIGAFCSSVERYFPPLDLKPVTSINIYCETSLRSNALFHRLKSIDAIPQNLLDSRFFRNSIVCFNVDLSRYILENSDQPDELIGSLVETNVLHFIAARGHIDLLKLILEQCQPPELKASLLHLKEYRGFTILHTIAAAPQIIDGRYSKRAQINGQYTAIAKYWIAQGADITIPDNDNETALHKAMLFCNMGIVEALLAQAKTLPNPDSFLNAKNRNGETALDKFCKSTLTSQAPNNSRFEYAYDADGKQVIQFGYMNRVDTDALTKQMIIILESAGCKNGIAIRHPGTK